MRPLTAVPAAELDATVADLAGALTAALPGVVTETKTLLAGAAQRDLDEQRRLEREAQVRRLLPTSAGSAALVTSRTKLAGLPGVHRHTIPPLLPEDARAWERGVAELV